MIEVRGLCFRAGKFAIRDVSLTVADGEYFVLMGRTGSGKSLLVKCLCGLIRAENGSVVIGGRDVTGLEPRHRRIGYVPQDGALFPHLDVAGNITFALRAGGSSRRGLRGAGFVIDMLGLAPLLGRHVETLSGGEKQKVALARALAAGPALLVLDEPVSSLDEPTRRAVCGEIRRVHAELKLVTVHVCHNLREAADLADQVAIMHEGRIVQAGPLEELRRAPADENVSALVGNPGPG